MERPAKRTFVRDLNSLADRYNAKAVLLVKKKKKLRRYGAKKEKDSAQSVLFRM